VTKVKSKHPKLLVILVLTRLLALIEKAAVVRKALRNLVAVVVVVVPVKPALLQIQMLFVQIPVGLLN
jgi:hypothetical protein